MFCEIFVFDLMLIITGNELWIFLIISENSLTMIIVFKFVLSYATTDPVINLNFVD